MTQALLRQAIEAIRRGDKATGQRLLAQVLRADPRSEAAWLWMSQIVENDTQRLDCLRRILAINPDNATARKGIALLEARMRGAAPEELAPPIPTVAPRPAPTQAAQPEQAAPPTSLFSDASTGQAVPAVESDTLEAAAPDVEAAPIVTPAPTVEPAPRQRKKKEPSPRPERRAARRRSFAPILLIVILVVIGGGIVYAIVSSQPAEPAAAPVAIAGRIAVSLERDGDAEIALVRSDGADLIDLFAREGADTDPAWSPDGARLAFTAGVDGASAIAVIDANGGGFAPLTHDEAHNVDPAWSPDGARLTFAADRTGDFDIYVMPATDASAAAAINLTRFEGDDRAPSWTPDSQSIVFQSDREGQNEIYRMDADGANVTRLTRDPADDADPSVSPDGEQIAFVSTRGGDADIYVMNLDGSDSRPVTDNTADDHSPSWTPDGSILYTSVLTDSAALFVVQPDGSDLRRVAGEISGTLSAAWQPVDVDPAMLTARAVPTPTVAAPPFELPEGALIFASDRDGAFSFYRMNIDGTDVEFRGLATEAERHPSVSPVASQLAFDLVLSDTLRVFVLDFTGDEPSVVTLTQESVSAHTPAWSPDGTRIAYEIDAEGGPDIALIQPDGSGAVRLINRPGYDGCLSWRPDGKQMAFTSDRSGDLDIFVMNEDGSAVRQLTQHPTDDRCPAWSPDGTQFAFVSNRNGEGVYLMAADGSNARLLAAIRNASQPVWSGDGQFLMIASDQDGDSDIYLISIEQAAVWNLTAASSADEVDPIWWP